MIEWLKVPVLKTGVFIKYRGFESHSILFLKAKNGIEPLFKDLQSFTLTVMLFSLFVNYNYEK